MPTATNGHNGAVEESPVTAPIPQTVTSDLELRLVMSGDRAAVVPCRLTYRPEAPYELSADFRTVDGVVTWVFARDLVRAGLSGPVGEGDVVAWPSRGPSGDVVCLALSSPSGRALLEADRVAMTAFLDRTEALVPPGSEAGRLDLDTLIARLLGTGPDDAGTPVG